MTTPKHRRSERAEHFISTKGNAVAIPPIRQDTRTRYDLEADPRVEDISFDEPDKVIITLQKRWTFPDGSHVRGFDLWEQARNAVRRADGPSLRDLKAEIAAGHLDQAAA